MRIVRIGVKWIFGDVLSEYRNTGLVFFLGEWVKIYLRMTRLAQVGPGCGWGRFVRLANSWVWRVLPFVIIVMTLNNVATEEYKSMRSWT